MKPEAIERLRHSLDLVSVVESRGVVLKRKGRSLFGHCPFHNDRTPSFVVNPELQLWNCLGACRNGATKSGGDVFAFVMKADNVTFPDALRRLSSGNPVETHWNSVEKPEDGRRPVSQRARGKDSISDSGLLLRVTEHYHRVFRERREGQDYLRSRRSCVRSRSGSPMVRSFRPLARREKPRRRSGAPASSRRARGSCSRAASSSPFRFLMPVSSASTAATRRETSTSTFQVRDAACFTGRR